jgi:Tfp pilus assembly protein PilN
VTLAVGGLHTVQSREIAAVTEREALAVEDSTRMAAVIAARKRARAERDSVEQQLAIISTIDSTRYVWAHVLDEVSRSLPAYTWLTSVQQTSAPPAPPVARRATDKAAGDSAAAKSPATPADSADTGTMRFRLVGQTVDIQALTLFMRDLEASPFVRHVQLARSEAVLVDNKDVTEFTLDGEYEIAPRELLRTRPLVVPVR